MGNRYDTGLVRDQILDSDLAIIWLNSRFTPTFSTSTKPSATNGLAPIRSAMWKTTLATPDNSDANRTAAKGKPTGAAVFIGKPRIEIQRRSVMSLKLICCVAFAGVATGAAAQNYEVRNDFQVWGAIEQMSSGLGTGCQMGDQNGCQAYQYVQDLAGYLIATNDACNYQGDQQACQFFQQAYYQLDNDFGQYMQFYAPQLQAMMGGGGTQMVNPMGATHEERMANINNWGQQMLDQGAANSALMDQRHADFMATIND